MKIPEARCPRRSAFVSTAGAKQTSRKDGLISRRMTLGDDQDLVARCLAGSDDAFAELVDRYKHLVFGVMSQVIADRNRVDDLPEDGRLCYEPSAQDIAFHTLEMRGRARTCDRAAAGGAAFRAAPPSLLGAGMVVDLNRAAVVAVAVIGLVWALIRKEPEIEAF